MVPTGTAHDAVRFVCHPFSVNTERISGLKTTEHQKNCYTIIRLTPTVLRDEETPAEAHHGLALRNLEHGKFREAVDEAQMATTLRPDWCDTSSDQVHEDSRHIE